MNAITVNTSTMQAVVATQYGGPEVLQVNQLPKPIPQDDEVLIRIRATSVNAAHTAMRTGRPLYGRIFLGLTKPKISVPGTDLAGEVEAVGKNVSRFSVGDQVFGSTDIGGGCYAEYVSIPEKSVLLHKPAQVSFTEASALVEGSTTSLPFLRDFGNIQPGQKVLINGASGSMGTAAVQLAKYFGAEVTAVSSTANLEWVQELGADQVIDYTREDFTRKGQQYDLIFDTVGKSSFSRCKRALTKNGIYLSPVLGIRTLLEVVVSSVRFSIRGKGKRAIFSATGLRDFDERFNNLVFIQELIQAGKLEAIIDRTYSLEEIVKAHRYVDRGHKKGNVVVIMDN
ncbi:MAG: NAD(P)-dependent alcohol dehydrogenase [Cyclobacteriaceae bacterium]